ncbi:MAG TPA: Calx-beta domain-containing protein [Pyrinomonadaceae bacterium]|nr:Calx-beta domain-containing protein [Pyrinomonadaceae bacterium]
MNFLRPRLAALKLSTRLFTLIAAFGIVACALGATAYMQSQQPKAQQPPPPAERIGKPGVLAPATREGIAETPPLAPIGDLLPTVASNYTNFTTTTGSLTDMTTGTTQLLGANIDDTASALTNIGFDFYFQGARFSQFSVNDNGVLRLGAAAQTGSPYKPLAQAGIPILTAYGADQRTHAGDGKVHFKVTGSAPDRVLVVEWLNNQSTFNTGGTADLTYQIRLFETTGVIQYVYGKATMSAAGAADANSRDPHIGFSSSNTAGTVGSVTAAQSGTPAPTFNGASATPVANLYTAGVIPVLNSAADGSRRTFTFTPPTPNAPTNLTFTAVTPSSYTLNWADSANETIYAIYRSTDGTNYSFVNTAAQNATTFAATGLTPSTNYFWQVFAVSEGALSSALTGNQATAAPGNISSTAVGGNWSATTTWVGGVVPTASDNVTIADAATVTIDSAATANAFSLSVGTGLVAPTTLIYNATTARTLTVATNVTIASNGIFQSAATGTITTHVLSVGGNLTNNGVLDFSTNSNTAGADITFTGAANNTFGGTGATTDVRSITINKGTSNANILELNPTAFTVRGAATDATNGYLTLTNGTYKISGTFTLSSRTFTANYTIAATAGIWLNNPNYTVSGINGSPTNAGLLRLTQGTYNVGTASGNSMGGNAGAVFIIEGGTLNTTGRFSPQSAVSYTQSAGTVNVCTVGQSSSAFGSFELFSTSSSFTMSGGTIVLNQASTAATTPLDFDILSGTVNYTGGTLQVGSAATATNFNFRINGNAPAIIINNTTNNKTATMLGQTVAFGDTTVSPGTTLNLNGFLFAQVGANLFNNGTILGNTAGSRLYFAGGSPQQYGGSGVAGTNALPLQSLDFDSAGVTLLAGSANNIIANRVILFSGNVTNSNKITLGTGGASQGIVQIGNTTTPTNAGSFDVPPIFNFGTGGQVISYLRETNPRTTGNEVNPTRVLTTMTVDNNVNGMTIAGGDLAVTGALALTNGTVTTGSNTLISSSTGTLTRTNGYVIGNLRQTYTANGSKTFPVGTASGFSPVVSNVTAGTGDMIVSATQGKLPGISGANALARYWTLTGTGLTADLQFFYLAGDVTGTESNYAIVKQGSGVLTLAGGSVNASTHVASINGVSSFSNWTLAEPSAIISGTIQLDSATYSGGESAGTITINATRTGGTDGTVTVSYATADGTASSVSNADYQSTAGTLTWLAGDGSAKSFNVPITSDTDDESDETFTVTLSNPTGGAMLGSPTTATVTIQDDDTATLPNVVYVDDDFTGPNGSDPDGAGPATEIGYDAFPTVQGGVTGVASGGTVNVAAGTYTEQVIIGKSLTLAGAGAATTTIATPATLVPGIGGNLVLVEVNGGATVNASGIAVAGPRVFNGCSAQIFYGVFVSGAATLNLSNSTVRDIRLADPSLLGCQDGIAIRAGSQALSQTATLSLNNVSVTNYQKSAVIVDGTGTTASITNSTLTGQGVPANIAANAIQIGRGAGATVTGNNVSGNLCNNGSCGPDPFTQAFSTGALVFSTSAAVSFSNNTFSNNDVGIYNNAANTTVSGNTFTANRYENLFLDEGNANASDNNMSGPSNVGVLAISYFGNTGNSTGTLTRNNITGATTGLQMLDDTSGADNFTPQLTAHFNRIVSTTTAIDNPQNQNADLENNWWGCNAGPGNTGCGTVTGTGADYNPWFVMSASATPNSIVPGGTSNVAVDMTKNSNGDTPATTLPDLPVSYSATNGTMMPTSATVSSGVSSSTFTSTNSNSAVASATVDNETVNVPITVNAPAFSVDDVTHMEGNSGTTSYLFTVTKTGATNLPATVQIATVDGTATVADNDYQANSTTLNFGAADMTMQFTVLVNGDTNIEPNEAFTVHLSNPSGATISDADGTGTITNDDRAPANVVYVDDDWANVPAGTDPDGAGPATEMGYDAFSTVQGGVNGVASGGTVNVAAGNYFENPTVNKPLSLIGANAGVAGSGTRGAESFIRSTGAANLAVIAVTGAANVTINGFMLDGDDPNSTGIALTSGEDTNASYGVRPTGAVSNLVVSNNIIRRVEIGLRGDVASQGNSVTRNLFDSIGHFDFGYAVSIRNNFYCDVTDNKMTRVWTGIHANNHNGAGGPASWSLSNNEIHSYAGGILYWLQFNGATGATIASNQITAETTGAVANNFGVLFVSIQNAVNPSFTGNTITGHNYGIGLFNVPTTNNITLGSTNSIANSSLAGLFLTDNLNFNPIGLTNFLAGGPGAASTVNVNGLSITGNTGSGVKVEGATNTQTLNVNGATIRGMSGTRGVETVGAQAAPSVTSSEITGFDTGFYLSNASGGPQVTNAHFNRVVATTTAATTTGGGTFNANLENNWWGCNAGPGNTGCGAVSGSPDFTPWLVLTVSASPNTIMPGGMSTVTADLLHNSDGAIPSNTTFVPNTPVNFSATEGTVSPMSGTITNGVAQTVFTSTSANNGTASATVDNQTTSTTINVTAPTLSIDDVTMAEGNSGTTAFIFTVTRTGNNSFGASVDYATVDGTATSPSDFAAIPTTTLTFAPNEMSKQITVNVVGNKAVEPDEAFTVHLSNPSGATISDADGTGTITNDDTVPNVVYVDDDFTGAAGTDPDGAGPANEIGYDAFKTIQGGIDGVAPNGTVNVAAGSYGEDVNVNKTVSLLGAGSGTTTIHGPIGGSGTTVFITASNSTVANFTITRDGNNTTDWENAGLNSAGIAIQGQAISNALIRDNVITGNRTGIDINNSNGHTVRNNSIDFNRTGFIFRNQTDSMRVMENFITNNWTVGVLFLDASGGTNSPRQSSIASAFTNNNISANWYGQVVDRQSGGSIPAPGTTNLKNFRGNWFGSTMPVVTTANSTEPGYAAQIPVAYGGTASAPGGQPDIAGPASANIKYIPFLQSGTDTNIETTPGRGTNGFQGVSAQTTLVVYPPNQNGWVISTSGTATASFVNGPATPPLGVGSGQLSVGSNGGSAAQFRQTNFNGTPLSDLNELSYSTYTSNDGSAPQTGDQTIYIIINTDRDGNGTLDTLLFFEPEYQHGYTAAVPDQGDNVLNTWQTWNARGGGWYAIDPSSGAPVFAGPGSNVQPLNNFITAFPAALIHNASSGSIRLVAGFGAGSWDNFVGNVDKVVIGVNSTTTTYDFEPLPQLSIDDVTQAEGDSGTTAFNFTVALSRAVDVPVTFTVATADNTATAPSDYAAVSPTPVTIPAGETSAPVTVQVNGDTTFEPDETFFVNISNPSNATISDGQGVGTITNDDPVPSISIGDRTLAEGDSGTTAFDFAVTLSNASSTPITVHYSTADGTASASSDYAGVADAILMIPAETTSGTITINVNGDMTYEANETFFVNLSNPSGATIADGQGLGTITNDDAPPATLVVNTTDDADDGFCLSDHCSLREAINASNLFADTNTVTFQIPVTDARHFYYADDSTPGQVSQAAISTTTADDSANTDLDPDWAHSWWSIQPAAPLPGITQPTVIDGHTQMGASANTLAAGSDAVLRIELSGGFVPANEYGLTITAINSTVKGLVINRFAHSGIAVQGATPTNNTIQGNRIGTDVSGMVALGNGDRAAVEFNASNGNMLGGPNAADRNLLSGGNAYGVFVINGASGNTVQGNLIGTDASGSLDLGNAQIGVLIDNRTGNTIRANVISGNGSDGIQIRNNLASGTNNVVQGNFIGTNATGATAAGNTGHGIADVRSGSDMSVGGNTIGGAGAGEANTIAFNGGDGVAVVSGTGTTSGTTISRNSIHTNTGLGIDLADNGVTPNDDDDPDTGANDLQNFPVITSAVTSSMTIINGTLNSTPSTTFTVEFFSNAACDASGNGEGQTFVGSLTNVTTNANGDATFMFQTASPVAAGQFITATATNPAGSTSEFSACHAVESAGSIQFSSPTFTVSENGTQATITVTRTGGTGGAVSATFNTSNGTATAGQDYTAVNNVTVMFADGDASPKTVNVPITDDNLYEGDETVNLMLSNPQGGATLGSPSTAVLTITENDPLPAISIDDVTRNEGNSGITFYSFTLSLSRQSVQTVSVTANTADGTATAPSDYTAITNQTITFAPFETIKTITVLVNGDTTFEDNETFFVNLSNPMNATLADGQGLGTITNDDAPGTALIVNTTDDNDDGSCQVSHCSLREAINAANLNVDANTISFQIPATDARHFYYINDNVAGQVTAVLVATTMEADDANIANIDPDWPHSWWSIRPGIGGLPNLANPVTIDGYTQTGASVNTSATITNAVLRLELLGTNAGAGGDGLRVVTRNSVVRGFSINRFNGDGIVLKEDVDAANDGDSNAVRGNYIGTDISGTVDVGNGANGITTEVDNTSHNSDTNTIGGTIPADRNLISGNTGHGILMTFSSGNIIRGNIIGLAANGTTALGNSGAGVEVTGSFIGGDDAADGTTDGAVGARNVISANGTNGIQFVSTGASTVQGNYIGTDVTGTLDRGNAGSGINSSGFSKNIGGTSAGAGNVISGNDANGIVLSGGNGNLVFGNFIGTQADGTTALPNGANGITLTASTIFNTIGGTNAGEANRIAFNGGDGINLDLTAGASNALRGNSIYSNGTTAAHLGIDLGADGVTPNDPQDPDTGANSLQNFPVLASATVTGSTKKITGMLNSTPNQIFTVDFYANASCDASGNGEGQTHIGSITTDETDANGNVSFSFNPSVLTVGQIITATATNNLNNTSEFSACVMVVGGTAGDIHFTSATYTVAENGGMASITVERVGGADGQIMSTFNTSNGTATAGQDYTAVNNHTITFNDGETGMKTVNVPILDDNVYEGDETVNLSLSGTTVNIAGQRSLVSSGTQNAVLTITDAADTPAISINDVFVSEPPAAGTSNAVFTVTLSHPSNAPVTVDYQTADGTATAPDDYNAVTTTTLTFAPNETSKTITVTVNFDNLTEGNETFTVNLSNPTGGATIADGSGTGTITDPVAEGQLLISEFRFRGPTYDVGGGVDGSRDEFIELYNNTESPLTVSTTDGSDGWSVAALSSDGMSAVPLVTIPAGTVIPARAHYLVANSDQPVNPATGGYSLGAYAAPDKLYLPDIADNSGVAVFATATSANYATGNRLDAVGFSGTTGATADMFREGAGLVSPGANDGQYAFTRKLTSGFPQDTDVNADDFTFISTDGGTYGGVQSILGAPGPENKPTSPVQRNGVIKASLIDGTVSSAAPPNRVRSGQIQPGVPNAFGTLSIQRRFKNTLAVPVTRLRFRVVDITTLNTPVASSPQADLRVLSSTGTVTNSQGQEVVTVTGLTLETPPAQPNGGGLNSSLTVIPPGGMLAPGATIDVQFLLGVQQQGAFRFLVNVEALPGPSPAPAPDQANPRRSGTKTTDSTGKKQ